MTSALPYIHGVPHLGNVAGSLLPADLYHRYLDLRGHENIFICGSDEHGTPLELSAIEAGESPEEHADRQHQAVRTALRDFDLDFSLYGRTHTRFNEERTHDIFRNLYRNGYIVEKAQELPYCRTDERFLADRYIEGECPECGGLARGDQCDDCGTLLEPEELVEPHCTICDGTDITFRETKNLFLELSKFEDDLRDWLAANDPIPDSQKQEVLNLIDEGLEDRCITRDIRWGFDVPTDLDGIDPDIYDDKVLYVWFDAPIGYIGITQQHFSKRNDEERWKDYWMDDDAATVYSIGKDNTIFHSIIFPSMLMGGAPEGEAYNLPDHEFIQQYLMWEGQGFSKSRNIGLWADQATDLLEPDYWRFYLASALPENHDTNFAWEDFEAKVNGELNDTVGNFVNRVLTLTDKWFDGQVPDGDLERYRDVLDELADRVERFDAAFEQEHSPKQAVQQAVAVARLGDEFLSREEPWMHEEKQADVIATALRIVEAVAVVMYPFTPAASRDLQRMLVPDATSVVDGRDRLETLLDGGDLEPGAELGDRTILFEKVDVDDLADEMDRDDGDMDDMDDEDEDMVSFDDFQRMDIRTGTIVDVADHPNADKLYLLQIDIGGETKQSCAGLRPHFEADELEGRDVVVLANLEPAELRGETSECMVLAADDGDTVSLLRPDEPVPDGTGVR